MGTRQEFVNSFRGTIASMDLDDLAKLAHEVVAHAGAKLLCALCDRTKFIA